MNILPIGLIGDIGGGEILLIVIATLLLFGGERLPSIARTLGKSVEALRKASQDFKDQLLNADHAPSQDIPDTQAGTELRAVRPARPESPNLREASLPASDTTHSAPHTPSPKELPPRDPAG